MGERREEEKRCRVILQNYITKEECKELEFIHKCSSSVGYRPNVFSTTLSHLIATNSSHFLLPFLPIRERLKEKVEELFGCPYELFVEFSGLISWIKGGSIGWHSDDNRPYLKQRHFTAVCYLNSYGEDFQGGLFHFRDGEPATLAPMAGDVAIYTADSSNIHSVDEITDGERLTLTLWFSRDRAHDEDAKLISLLSEKMLCNSNHFCESVLPMPASSNMYWFSSDHDPDQQSGFNICCTRMHMLGFDIYSSQPTSSVSDFTELLVKPLQLARGNELFRKEFVNILHALQVVQFYCWKASELQNSSEEGGTGTVLQLSESQQEKIAVLNSLFVNDQLVEAAFGCKTCMLKCGRAFNWAKFSAAFAALEDYICKLHKELLISLPYWRTQQIMYKVSFDDGLGN